jgi:hypothetical protein
MKTSSEKLARKIHYLTLVFMAWVLSYQSNRLADAAIFGESC